MSLVLLWLKPHLGATIQETAILVLAGGCVYGGILLILRDSMVCELLQTVKLKWKGHKNAGD